MMRLKALSAGIIGFAMAATSAVAQQDPDPMKNLPENGMTNTSRAPVESGGAQQGGSGKGAVSQKAMDAAFERALQEFAPLTPGKIRQMRRYLNKQSRAKSEPIENIDPRARSIKLQLDPGEDPPVIHTVKGHAATITISDVTGKPWPIRSVTTGNPKAFSVNAVGEKKKPNAIVVTPKSLHQRSNLIVKLVDHPIPITMTLDAGNSPADYRVDVKVAARGPEATYNNVQGRNVPDVDDKTMLSFLDGLPPKNAKKLDVSGGRLDGKGLGVKAWTYQNDMYVRTRSHVLSPNYEARTTNVSGVNVYRMSPESWLLISRDGNTAQVNVKN